MLKNPWNHLRWKGNFCENDTVNWTPEMKKALNYDPKSAQQFDNGNNICYVLCINYNDISTYNLFLCLPYAKLNNSRPFTHIRFDSDIVLFDKFLLE